jgi:hypothetical protein
VWLVLSKQTDLYVEVLLIIPARTDEKCPKNQPRLVVIIPPVGDVKQELL